MIKIIQKNKDGKPLIGLGISLLNIEKLQEGRPILIELSELGLEGQLFIFTGDTEQSMLADLKKAGLVPVDVEV